MRFGSTPNKGAGLPSHYDSFCNLRDAQSRLRTSVPRNSRRREESYHLLMRQLPSADKAGKSSDRRLSFARFERRQRIRFPIIAQTKYTLAGKTAGTSTRNISSGGVFLRTDTILPVGEWIKLLIDWPVALDQRPLRLLTIGRVLRSDETGTAVGITRYKFQMRDAQSNPGSSQAQ